MLEFMMSGGVAMWFILLFGGTNLGVGIAFLVSASQRREAFFRALSNATLFATLTGVVAGIAAVMSKVPVVVEWAHNPDRPLIVMAGLGEALSNGILGFALLALAWFLFAFGKRRQEQASEALRNE